MPPYGSIYSSLVLGVILPIVVVRMDIRREMEAGEVEDRGASRVPMGPRVEGKEKVKQGYSIGD